MKKKAVLLLSILTLAGGVAIAEEALDTSEREPSNVNVNAPPASKRTYPGGADEDDLQVQAHIPEAGIKTDARSVQGNVFKTLYNQELKDERQENVEE